MSLSRPTPNFDPDFKNSDPLRRFMEKALFNSPIELENLRDSYFAVQSTQSDPLPEPDPSVDNETSAGIATHELN